MSDRVDNKGDRLEGTLDEAKGKAKQGWGEASGDDQTHAEGQGDETKGKAQQAVADVKDKVDDLKDRVSG